MKAAEVGKRLNEIQNEYSEINKNIAGCQDNLAKYANRKVYLEGAFNELKSIYDTLVKEEENSEAVTEPDKEEVKTEK